jgi:hypothetical protein
MRGTYPIVSSGGLALVSRMAALSPKLLGYLRALGKCAIGVAARLAVAAIGLQLC